MTTPQNFLVKTDSQVQLPSTVKQLATPTDDLTRQAVLTITEALNLLISNAFALYIEAKNFHWHVADSQFWDYPPLFDEQADQIFATADLLAERIRQVGGTTIRSTGHISRLYTIQDDKAKFVSAGEMLLQLMEDTKYLARLQQTAHEVCDRNQDVASANVLETMIDETD